MTDPVRVLGLIAARGGSRRLPRKNVLPLAGKPLLAWTAQAALDARHVSRVILSTDDEEIAEVGRAAGLEVPFLRPAELASDSSTSEDVVLHAARAVRDEGGDFDYLVLLQPTSPLRTAADIDLAVELALERGADAVVSVCETDHPVEWSGPLPKDRSMTEFYRSGVRGVRSQDLPIQYRLNGAIYLYAWERLLLTGSVAMDDSSYAYVMERERSVDIDEPIDFELAQCLLERSGDGE